MARTRNKPQREQPSSSIDSDVLPPSQMSTTTGQWTTLTASDPPLRDRPAQEDANNPYFMGTGDHPGLILASPPLKDTNFQQWARDFKLSVGVKNKIGFLTRTIPQPSSDHHLFDPLSRCNQMVMSWIIHPVSPEIKSSIIYLDSAAVMWTELNTRFNQGNEPRIFDLRTPLILLHQGDDFVSAYFTKLKAIWDEINELRPRTPCTCAAANDSLELQNLEQVLQFLTGLNESYHVVRPQVLLLDPFPSIYKKISTIVQEERLRKIRPLATTNLIAASTSNPPSLPPSRTKKMRPTCSHCQKPGHLKEKCYFIHGFPPGYGTKNVNNKPTVHPVTASVLPSPELGSQAAI
ncbi:uncharacterized protein LOC133800146 [Humulus lupulus]|uniref:uncharacterized protein LOC133800146 n=1 Tax=Humulus lupulus TaxID=3486 RepID=UPI002B4107F8|nr:uncharacterized protein LOC133800146 [Humulus lupulus]